MWRRGNFERESHYILGTCRAVVFFPLPQKGYGELDSDLLSGSFVEAQSKVICPDGIPTKARAGSAFLNKYPGNVERQPLSCSHKGARGMSERRARTPHSHVNGEGERREKGVASAASTRRQDEEGGRGCGSNRRAWFAADYRCMATYTVRPDRLHTLYVLMRHERPRSNRFFFRTR